MEKSPVGCGRKCPRRWKESEDSVLEMDDLLPGEAQASRHKEEVNTDTEKELTHRIKKLNCRKTDQA